MYKRSINSIIRVSDGASIPPDPENVDYQAVLEFIAAGNTPAPADPPTADQIRAQYEAAAQSLLDSTACTWGYDSLMSAASYASSGAARYKAEADALITWRDALWQAAYNVEVSVQGGAAMPATEADFLAMLPPAPVRPQA